MKLPVTDGAGFIGSASVRRRLASTGDPAVVLDLLTYAGNRATWYRGNRALWESMRGPEWGARYATQYGTRLEQSTPA